MRSAVLFLCLLVGIWFGAAASLQWAKISTPRSVTQLGAVFSTDLLKGDHYA